MVCIPKRLLVFYIWYAQLFIIAAVGNFISTFRRCSFISQLIFAQICILQVQPVFRSFVAGTKDRTEEQCRELLRKFWSLSYYLEFDEAIYFLIKSHMEKKTYLLSNLKKQVIALKTQLEKLQKHKSTVGRDSQNQSRQHHQSITHSSRFNSISLDGYDLERGKRKFRDMQSPFKNLAQVIRQKSAIVKAPPYSIYRRTEYLKTCQNFSSETPEYSKSRSRSPNPITGEGYRDQRKGVKMCSRQKPQVVERPSCRRHFDFYY